MSGSTFAIENMIKSAQWERAKGELRAMVQIQGSYPGPVSTEKYNAIDAAVEAFIAEVEDEGWQE